MSCPMIAQNYLSGSPTITVKETWKTGGKNNAVIYSADYFLGISSHLSPIASKHFLNIRSSIDLR